MEFASKVEDKKFMKHLLKNVSIEYISAEVKGFKDLNEIISFMDLMNMYNVKSDTMWKKLEEHVGMRYSDTISKRGLELKKQKALNIDELTSETILETEKMLKILKISIK